MLCIPRMHTLHNAPPPPHLVWHCAARQVGIAGRTGCGKSTLLLTLFRIVEPSSGRIVIDGLDIASIGLYDLRSRLALVPQASGHGTARHCRRLTAL